ncbi:MAG: transcription termination/antitermination protein NusA [Clostridia bacterium]|nr:transcription termination/antitermination protein NusA [Clostridia bacterium]
MNAEFIQALRDIERDKGIPADVLLEAVEAALMSAYKKNFGSSQNIRITMDRNSGEISVLAAKTVVDQVEDTNNQISLQEARTINPNYEPGDVVEIEVTPKAFGRIAAQTAKQVVVQRIREAERALVYEEFANREADIVTGVVRRYEMRNVYIDLGRAEAVMLPSDQIPSERYRQGERLKVYITEVKRTSKGPQILVSRTHPGLVKRLFELEVPEIRDGIVEIKAIAREPGARSKVAMASRDQLVDPVGTCVGHRGMRVQAIVNELRGEKIDVVRWDADPATYVANALSPAKVVSVRIDGDSKLAQVIVPDYQLSLAIGKEGQNARLAAKLTGWRIDIKSESKALEERQNEGEGDDV